MAYRKSGKSRRPAKRSYAKKTARARARRSYQPRAVKIHIVHETANAISRPAMPAGVVPIRRAKF